MPQLWLVQNVKVPKCFDGLVKILTNQNENLTSNTHGFAI